LPQRLESSTIFVAVAVCDDDNHVLSALAHAAVDAVSGLVADLFGAVVVYRLSAKHNYFHLQQNDH
jgi:hypothetical protein